MISKNYLKNNPWYSHHASAKARCHKKHGKFSYIIRDINYLMTLKDVKDLWIECNADNFNIPTLHRKNNTADYTKDNCIFLDKNKHDSFHNLGANPKLNCRKNYYTKYKYQ